MLPAFIGLAASDSPARDTRPPESGLGEPSVGQQQTVADHSREVQQELGGNDGVVLDHLSERAFAQAEQPHVVGDRGDICGARLIEQERGLADGIAGGEDADNGAIRRAGLEDSVEDHEDVSGGTARNIVPERCALRAEARSHSESKLAAQIAHMSACLREAARLTGAQVEIVAERSYTAFALADDSPVVQRAAQAARRLGLDPVSERGGGGSDANIFNEHALPSLMMATGALDVHTPQEQLNVAASLECLEWLVGTATISDK